MHARSPFDRAVARLPTLRAWLVCAVVGCRSSASPPAPAPEPPPNDHQLHVTSTPESGATHLQVRGLGVDIKDLHLPASFFVPVVGAFDVALDLHVPTHDGALDFRGATGDATARCAAGCAVAYAAPASTSPTVAAGFPAPIPVARFEARAVFADGRAEITKWNVDAQDLRVEVSGRLELAAAVDDSLATLCIRVGEPSAPLTPESPAGVALASADIAIDARGLMSFKLAGKLAALVPVDFGCDGQTRPAPKPVDAVAPVAGSAARAADDADPALAAAITKHTDTAYDLDRAIIDKLLANPMQLAGGARIVPATRDGLAHGFKIFAIRPGSLAARLGLMNGDTLVGVNSQVVSTASDALVAYTALRGLVAGDKLTLAIERRDQPVTLAYTIR